MEKTTIEAKARFASIAIYNDMWRNDDGCLERSADMIAHLMCEAGEAGMREQRKIDERGLQYEFGYKEATEKAAKWLGEYFVMKERLMSAAGFQVFMERFKKAMEQ